jgi:hypothetical protein
MQKKSALILAGLMFLASPLAFADVSVGTGGSKSNIFYGGAVGLSFGDVQYVELSPMIGMHFTPKLSAGVSAMYRWVSDDRYNTELNTQDYGATLFGRYRLTSTFFLQAEYEYLNYEYYTSILNMTTERSDFTSLLAGGGISTPAGQNASFYMTALYNFSYDEPDSPYDSPWVFRLGVAVGF